MSLISLILLAGTLRATTYGYGELMCGDVGRPAPCVKGAVTASGEMFDPSIPSAALPAPFNLVLRAQWIGLLDHNNHCRRVRLNDKSNPRWIGKRGFDLSPAAVELITGKPPSRYWSGKVKLCDLDESSSQASGHASPQHSTP